MHRVLLIICLCLLNLAITNSILLAAMPPIVSTEWLLQNKDNPNLILLDATNTLEVVPIFRQFGGRFKVGLCHGYAARARSRSLV